MSVQGNLTCLSNRVKQNFEKKATCRDSNLRGNPSPEGIVGGHDLLAVDKNVSVGVQTVKREACTLAFLPTRRQWHVDAVRPSLMFYPLHVELVGF